MITEALQIIIDYHYNLGSKIPKLTSLGIASLECSSYHIYGAKSIDLFINGNGIHTRNPSLISRISTNVYIRCVVQSGVINEELQ